MKNMLKCIVKKSKYYYKIRSYKSIGFAIIIVNYIFQRIFRIDSDFKYMKNYTSRVLNGKNLTIIGNNDEKIEKVFVSFIVSGNCYINALKGIEIGEGTIFSFGVIINSAGHDIKNLNIIPESLPIKIGKNCWLGANAVILPGVEIGDNTIVGAGSVVTKSFGNNKVIAGIPAKIIKEL